MKLNFNQFNKIATLSIAFLCLFATLLATTSFAQSIGDKDSNLKHQLVSSIEGTPLEIDSLLKIINDYPDLKTQYVILERILISEKNLSSEIKNKILFTLNMQDDWDTKKVVKRIKRLRRRSYFWAGAGIGVGSFLTVLTFALKT